jgi:uncharacterized protein (TIGR02001 family)
MKRLTGLFLGAAGLGALCTGAAQADAASALAPDWGQLSATLAVQSDYRFRGISQNDQDPSPEFSLNWSGRSGFYAGTWLAKVNFLDSTPTHSGTSLESDFFGGKHFALGDGTDLNVEAYYYAYPDHNSKASGVTDSFYETIVQLSHSWGNFTGTLSGAQSPDFFGDTGTAWWMGATGAYTINDWLSLSGNAGHQWVNHTGYTHWDLGLTATYRNFSLDARYVDTDLNAAACRTFTGGKATWCSSGFTATLSYNIATFL